MTFSNIFLTIFFIVQALSFPSVLWRSLSFTLGSETITNTIVDINGGNVQIYVPILSTDGLTLKLYYFDGNTFPPTQLAFKTFNFDVAISGPNVVSLNTKVLLSYAVGGNIITSRLVTLIKSTLEVETNISVSYIERGVFIRPYNYMVSLRDSQRVIDQPEVGGGIEKISYGMNTDSETTQLVHQRNFGKILTISYPHISQRIRTLDSNVDTFVASYPLPSSVILSTSQYQCRCFNADQTILYYFDILQRIVAINLVTNFPTTIVDTNIPNVIGCYFDVPKNAMIFITSTNQMKQFNMATLTTTATQATSYTTFVLDNSMSYASMRSGGTVDIYLVGPGANLTCSGGFYYEAGSDSCAHCPTGCSICSSNTTCSACISNFVLSGTLCLSNCSSNCIACSSPSACTTCAVTYFVDVSGLCASCPSNCDVCPNLSSCTTCATNYNLNGVSLCDPICPPNCLTCTSPTVCTLCIIGYMVDSVTFLCVPCPSNCDFCSSNTTCTTCSINYGLNESSLCVFIVVPTSGNSSSTIVIFFFLDFLTDLLENPVIRTVNKVPGGRRLFPFLCFLVNIDQIWLYQYHERQYGTTMDRLFDSIQQLENQKWSLLEGKTTEVVYEQFGTSRDGIQELIDTKFNYTGAKFKEREGRGQTFLPACWEFLTFNLLFVLIGFAVLRWGFRLLRKYRVSKLLRPFSMMIYLTPLLLDGNLQYFCFLLFSQTSLGFSLNPRDKFLNVLNYMLYFFIIWFSVVSSFLAYWLSRKLASYILDNWRTKIKGLLAYSLTNTIRMILLGGIHSLLRNHPAQLPLLLTTEVIYIAFLIFFMSFWRVHQIAFKVCFTISFAFVRICLQILLICQQSDGVLFNYSEFQSFFQYIIGLVLAIYLVSIYFATAWEIIYEIIEVLKPSKDKNQDKKDDKTKSLKSIQSKKDIQKTSPKKKMKEKISKEKNTERKLKSKSQEKKKKQKSCSEKKRKTQKEEKREKKEEKINDSKERSKSKKKKQDKKEVKFNEERIYETQREARAQSQSVEKKKKYIWTIKEVKQ